MTVFHYPPGDSPANGELDAGDLLLTGKKAQGIISLAIKLGQRLRGFTAAERQFSHSALILGSDGRIAEAEASGVVFANLSKYHEDDYIVVKTLITPADQARVREFAAEVVAAHTGYGVFTFIGLAIYCLTGTKLCLQSAGTAICSGFYSNALDGAGPDGYRRKLRYTWERPPFAMMPADLARHFKVVA